MNKKNEITPSLIGSSGDTLREAFGKALTEEAKLNKKIVVLDADIAGGTGVHHFRTAIPERFFQMGIAEQNMMSVGAGMADAGLIPFVTTFAVFCFRAAEQARLSIAYANRNVKIVASHPGLDVGPDGASAQSLEDIAVFRSIPGMTVISPSDPHEMKQAVKAIANFIGPVYMRTGRSETPRFLDSKYKFEIGKGKILKEGTDMTIVACGIQTHRAIEAAEELLNKNINVRVVNMSTIKPIDKNLLEDCIEISPKILVTEDHNVYGGLFSATCEALSTSKNCEIFDLCVNDTFGESGEPDELAEKYGISKDHIVKKALEILG
tara:strand:+ start:3932 stop:4897 length:966 start_codon:yes stop_codon:yes gene_type:complete